MSILRSNDKERGVRRYWPAIRLCAGLMCLCAGVLLVTLALALLPERGEGHGPSLVTFISFVGGGCFGVMFLVARPLLHNVAAGDRTDRSSETSAVDGASSNEASSRTDEAAASGGIANGEDLANLERKHAQLRKAIVRLRTSRKVVRRQNLELKALARRDPLTGCFNRRTLFSEFEKLWEAGKRTKKPLSCVMIDVDHFKSINDRFGHPAGDEVLKLVAQTLSAAARKSDIVCRYGGEEFCVLLPHVDLAEAETAAERFRLGLAAQPLGVAAVTASFGVSSCCLAAKHPQEMMEQADKALFAAKRSGRNKVMRFDLAPKDLLGVADEARKARDAAAAPVKSTREVAIPFQAVSGLLAALGYRHAETAEHCRRVADLCVMASSGLMSQKDAYLMEMAALLHDIGKLGVPDTVLLKAGPLSAEEWKTIRTHEGIGVEIIRAAFTSDELADLVRLQHSWFGGTPSDASLPKGPKIPLAARLIAVANAYDSMTTDHAYRKGILPADAMAELRRCSGTQFDPFVTEHFIKALTDLPAGKKGSRIEPLSISKQTALKIGVQIEKLALAADVQDLASLVSMANQLRTMAQEGGIATIAEAASRLEQSAAANSNQMDLMELTIDLLEMCRQTQRALLPAIPRAAKRNRPKTAESIDLKLVDASPTPILLARPPQYVKKSFETPTPPPR